MAETKEVMWVNFHLPGTGSASDVGTQQAPADPKKNPDYLRMMERVRKVPVRTLTTAMSQYKNVFSVSIQSLTQCAQDLMAAQKEYAQLPQEAWHDAPNRLNGMRMLMLQLEQEFAAIAPKLKSNIAEEINVLQQHGGAASKGTITEWQQLVAATDTAIQQRESAIQAIQKTLLAKQKEFKTKADKIFPLYLKTFPEVDDDADAKVLLKEAYDAANDDSDSADPADQLEAIEDQLAALETLKDLLHETTETLSETRTQEYLTQIPQLEQVGKQIADKQRQKRFNELLGELREIDASDENAFVGTAHIGGPIKAILDAEEQEKAQDLAAKQKLIQLKQQLLQNAQLKQVAEKQAKDQQRQVGIQFGDQWIGKNGNALVQAIWTQAKGSEINTGVSTAHSVAAIRAAIQIWNDFAKAVAVAKAQAGSLKKIFVPGGNGGDLQDKRWKLVGTGQNANRKCVQGCFFVHWGGVPCNVHVTASDPWTFVGISKDAWQRSRGG